MKVLFDNTALKSQNFNDKAKIHMLPCYINYEGDAKVENYFENSIKNNKGNLNSYIL